MGRYRPNPEPTTDLSAAELIARGYRRTSNAWRMVSRIDRPDWVDVLARSLHRAPADFYVPGAARPAGNWCDYYRRCVSKDTLTVSAETIGQIPSSGFDDCGYIP
jgi:hypothetical protein